MPVAKKTTKTKQSVVRKKQAQFNPNWRIILLGAASILALILALLTAYVTGWDARNDDIKAMQAITKAK